MAEGESIKHDGDGERKARARWARLTLCERSMNRKGGKGREQARA